MVGIYTESKMFHFIYIIISNILDLGYIPTISKKIKDLLLS
jgi:hypothetical protein